MFIFDTKLVKITEYYTDPGLKLEAIAKEIEKAKTGPKKTRKNKVLHIKSIDANDKVDQDDKRAKEQGQKASKKDGSLDEVRSDQYMPFSKN